MSVSGLVLTLDDGPDTATAVTRELLRAGVFTPGDAFGNRLTVALEADTPADAEHWYRWLAEVPGVRKVDLAYVHLESADGEVSRDR